MHTSRPTKIAQTHSFPHLIPCWHRYSGKLFGSQVLWPQTLAVRAGTLQHAAAAAPHAFLNISQHVVCMVCRLWSSQNPQRTKL